MQKAQLRVGRGKTLESSAGLGVNHLVPDGFGFEDPLDKLTGGAFATVGVDRVVEVAILNVVFPKKGE